MRNMLWCGICCDVECGCGVEWCEMWTVGCGTCCTLRCDSVKWWCRGKLQCNVISDVEHGGPR